MANDTELSKIRGPFRVYPKREEKEPISTMDEYHKEFLKALFAATPPTIDISAIFKFLFFNILIVLSILLIIISIILF